MAPSLSAPVLLSVCAVVMAAEEEAHNWLCWSQARVEGRGESPWSIVVELMYILVVLTGERCGAHQKRCSQPRNILRESCFLVGELTHTLLAGACHAIRQQNCQHHAPHCRTLGVSLNLRGDSITELLPNPKASPENSKPLWSPSPFPEPTGALVR